MLFGFVAFHLSVLPQKYIHTALILNVKYHSCVRTKEVFQVDSRLNQVEQVIENKIKNIKKQKQRMNFIFPLQYPSRADRTGIIVKQRY